jgi:hypothetical protein
MQAANCAVETHALNHSRSGIWVPACAGTTAVVRRGGIDKFNDCPRHRNKPANNAFKNRCSDLGKKAENR